MLVARDRLQDRLDGGLGVAIEHIDRKKDISKRIESTFESTARRGERCLPLRARSNLMKPITYSLQFRGQAEGLDDGLRKHGRAPRLRPDDEPDARRARGCYVWAQDDNEALFESTLAFTGDESFQELRTIFFSSTGTRFA